MIQIRNQYAQNILGYCYSTAGIWLTLGNKSKRIAWKARGLVEHDRFLTGMK